MRSLLILLMLTFSSSAEIVGYEWLNDRQLVEVYDEYPIIFTGYVENAKIEKVKGKNYIKKVTGDIQIVSFIKGELQDKSIKHIFTNPGPGFNANEFFLELSKGDRVVFLCDKNKDGSLCMRPIPIYHESSLLEVKTLIKRAGKPLDELNFKEAWVLLKKKHACEMGRERKGWHNLS